jgi:hypothetical protein
VLGSESEMEMLYLARRAASQEPAQPPAQQQQQQEEEGEYPQPPPRRSSRPSHAASAPPTAEHQEPEDDAGESPAATGDAEEQPQQLAEVCTTVFCILFHSLLFCCASRHNGRGDPSTCIAALTAPRHTMQDGQPRRRSHADSWKHSVRQVTRMLSSLHTMQRWARCPVNALVSLQRCAWQCVS